MSWFFFGIEWWYFPIIIALLIYAFRDKIWVVYTKWKKKHDEDKKLKETYRRIDLNKSAKFDQTQHIKDINAEKKRQMKKNREVQQDVKSK